MKQYEHFECDLQFFLLLFQNWDHQLKRLFLCDRSKCKKCKCDRFIFAILKYQNFNYGKF